MFYSLPSYQWEKQVAEFVLSSSFRLRAIKENPWQFVFLKIARRISSSHSDTNVVNDFGPLYYYSLPLSLHPIQLTTSPTSVYCAAKFTCTNGLNNIDQTTIHYCSNIKYAFIISSPKTWFLPTVGDYVLIGFHIDVMNTTCTGDGVMKTLTARMDADAGAPDESLDCQGYECRWSVGEMEVELPVEKEEIVGGCVASEEIVGE
jgi:hypothetical protein